jgi:uncharacterized cupredoxin-like copper-binding protein
MTRVVRSTFSLIAIVGLLVACSGGPTSGPVTATLKEWQISLSSATLKAGEITFNLTNSGDKEHEFVVRKTDLAPGSLPTNADGEVVEDDPALAEAGDPSEVEDIPAGSSDKSLTLNLTPGHYVVFCNIHVEDLVHYQKGMHTEFTVE